MPAYKKILPPSLFELHELRDAGLGRLVCEAVTTGLVTGLVIGFSRIAYTFINQDLSARFLASALSPAKVLLAAAFIALCACVAYFCSRKEPLAGGSGIPQVELALRGMLPMPWLRVLCCKFVGTLATMCGCLSLGRAAPSVQMGSAIGCGVGRLWHEDGMRPRFLVGGAAAGLTACFGAPWAGIAFAFEELRTFAAPAQLLFMGLAASSAWFMTDVVLGLGLVFPLPLAEFSMREIWLLPVLGLVCGVLCWLYNASIARLTMLADRFVSLRTRFFLAFGLGFAFLFIYPSVIDGLAPTLGQLAGAKQAADVLAVLWIAKIAFNVISGSSLSPGGLLMPLLIAGGYTGALATALLGLLSYDTPAAILVPLCMAGFFAGIVRAPLTATFLVAETTGTWLLLPALAAVSFITVQTANRLGSQPIFTFWRMRQLRMMRRAARQH